jgi:hypothetical protein
VAARGQRVEVRDAVRLEHDHLAVEDETILRQLQRAGHDQREAVGPVMAATT